MVAEAREDAGVRGAARPSLAAVRLWLYAVAGLVFVMIVLGGATRLTDSGLSITEWQPIMGALPPLSEADWQAAFAKYKEIPEYHLVNRGMSLEAFQFIFWWEWAHRFLGRLIGVAFAAPLAWFWLRGALDRGLAMRLAGVLGLGALQGGLGWFMVQSGLVDRIDVSQYRLAAHLGLAFLIFAALLWIAFDLEDRRRAGGGAWSRARGMAALITGAIFLQVLLGALVAGLKAGLAYNTWPLMDGAIIPEGLGRLTPWYLNLFENETTVQLNHRLMAYAVAGLVLRQAWELGRGSDVTRAVRTSILALAAAVAAQIGLGVWTLLAFVPLWLGLVHQGGAAVVLGLALRHLHETVVASRA